MLDANGAVRPVYGVAGSVTVGEPIATGILSIACSRKICLKTDIAALLALDEEAAFVYFQESKQLARWHAGQLDSIDFVPGGDVLSLRVSSGVLEFAVRRDGGVWIMRGQDVIDSLPDDAGPVMLLTNGVLFANAEALVLRRPDGTEVRFDIKGVEALFFIGEGYVQARVGLSTYALRIEPGREQIFLLPEAPP